MLTPMRPGARWGATDEYDRAMFPLPRGSGGLRHLDFPWIGESEHRHADAVVETLGQHEVVHPGERVNVDVAAGIYRRVRRGQNPFGRRSKFHSETAAHPSTDPVATVTLVHTHEFSVSNVFEHRHTLVHGVAVFGRRNALDSRHDRGRSIALLVQAFRRMWSESVPSHGSRERFDG
jgi:hypothetical protein